MYKRQDFLNIIEKNISKHGYHVTFVNGGQNPHFAYTIGLYKKFGFELVIAGGYITVDIYEQTFDLILKGLNLGLTSDSIYSFKKGEGEKLKLLEVHPSWKKKMILGVYDYYNIDNVRALQIIPGENRLLDEPIMSEPWAKDDPIWCWLDRKWDEQVPKTSYAVTNIQFLKGESITEIMRWEDGYWEMFVGASPDVPDDDVRVLPLGTMLGIDKSLRAVISLKNGDGLWRENKESEWQEWV